MHQKHALALQNAPLVPHLGQVLQTAARCVLLPTGRPLIEQAETSCQRCWAFELEGLLHYCATRVRHHSGYFAVL